MKTQAGVVFGTPQYMSPEQGRGLPLDARSDLYALGVLAFEMLTGRVPFHDDNPMTVIQMQLRAEVPPLPQNIPYSVQQVVRRAMEKDPARRYQSAGEMMQHCQQVFAELNQGGASIGAGGVPRTVVAAQMPGGGMGPPMGMNPGMGGMGGPPPAMPPGGGYGPPPAMPPGGPYGGPPAMPGGPGPGGGHAAKTMIAGQSPFAGGMQPGMQPGGYPQGMGGPPPPMGGPPPPMGMGGPPPGMGGPGMPPGMGSMPPGMGGVASSPMQKTMMAQVGGGAPGYNPAAMRPGQQEQQANKTVMLSTSEGVVSIAHGGAVSAPPEGASTAFWIISLLTGIAVGVLSYIVAISV
jgi:hypothetical protein